MFPCFDQPDLKAKMKLRVTAPQDWEVISTTRESSVKAADNDRKLWTFAETPPLSTYLFSLHAGPYAHWNSTAGTIPLRLFARQSMKKYVIPADWFTPTQQGLKFYGEYFAFPYPFKKYDQIIAPDFNAGAMENVAAVTFSERFIHRGPTTREQRENLAEVILHEMAHMWFGDLVTMKWWNGLWLNESFATFMSATSSHDATEYKEAWTSFFHETKSWAYVEDQQVTTHPINGAVPDTDSAMSIFDGITYGKGASVLKQLSFFLGPDKFREGVRLYFKKNAYGNTTLADFIGSLEKASKKDLSNWSKLWLESAGVDTIQVKYECQGTKITSFELHQTPPAGQTAFRPHRTQIGLFERDGTHVQLKKTVTVDYNSAVTPIPTLVGSACPLIAYPNVGDYDYVKVRLDERALFALRDSLSDIADPFDRLLFWPSLFEMVRDGELKPQEYLKIVEQNFPHETDLKIGKQILTTLGARRGSGFNTPIYFLPRTSDADKKAVHEALRKFEDLVWKKVSTSATGSDWLKMSLDGYIDFVQTAEGAEPLALLLEPGRSLKGWAIDQDRRWNIVKRLNSIGYSSSASLLEIEQVRDSSEIGIQAALSAQSSRPDFENKQMWVRRVTDNTMTLSRINAVLRTLLPAWQNSSRWELADQFYVDLPKLIKSRDLELVDTYTSSLMPAVCTPVSADKLDKFINAHGSELPPTVLKDLRSSLQEDQRCVNVRAKAANP